MGLIQTKKFELSQDQNANEQRFQIWNSKTAEEKLQTKVGYLSLLDKVHIQLFILNGITYLQVNEAGQSGG